MEYAKLKLDAAQGLTIDSSKYAEAKSDFIDRVTKCNEGKRSRRNLQHSVVLRIFVTLNDNKAGEINYTFFRSARSFLSHSLYRNTSMTVELKMLVLTAIVTTLLWVPYILSHIVKNGLVAALTYKADDQPLPAWAGRLKKAHANAIENLPIFAIAVLVAHAVGLSNNITILAAQTYLIARILHVIGYTTNLPLARTLTFAAGWAATLAIFSQILAST